MVTNVSTCHAPLPDPPVPAALAERAAARLAAPCADVLVACHVPGASLAVAAGLAAKPRTARKAVPSAARAPGYAAAAAPKTKTGTTTARKATAPAPTLPSALAFLDDKNLSLEEKLMRLLAYLNDKWEKDIEKKMREASGTDAKAAASSSSSGLAGAVGRVASVAGTALQGFGLTREALANPFVRQVAGPALAGIATVAGFPELAPAALKYGSSVVDAVASVLPATGSTATASAPASTGGTTSSIGEGQDAQLKLMEIQRLQNLQNQMFSAVSNMLQSRHQARMSVIQNLR